MTLRDFYSFLKVPLVDGDLHTCGLDEIFHGPDDRDFGLSVLSPPRGGLKCPRCTSPDRLTGPRFHRNTVPDNTHLW